VKTEEIAVKIINTIVRVRSLTIITVLTETYKREATVVIFFRDYEKTRFSHPDAEPESHEMDHPGVI